MEIVQLLILMITLTQSFLDAYPDAFVDNDFVVVSPLKSAYHSGQRMMIEWERGFNDPVNDVNELIRYQIYPCDVIGEWISHDRKATFTKVVTVEEFNELAKDLMKAGYKMFRCDASTKRRLVNADGPTSAKTQAGLDRLSFARTMKANGFGN